MSNELKSALLGHNVSSSPDEDAIKVGQLMGYGFLYALSEKEGGAKMDAFKKSLLGFSKKVKAAPGKAWKATKAAPGKIDTGAKNLGEKIIKKMTREPKPKNIGEAFVNKMKGNEGPSDLKKRLVGYGVPAAGVGAVGTAGYFGYKKHKEKTASENIVTADNLILRLED